MPLFLRETLRRPSSTKESGRKGSNVYEVNQWLWRFRGNLKPGLGGPSLSVSETEVRRMAVMQEGARCGHAALTKRRSNAPKEAAAQ